MKHFVLWSGGVESSSLLKTLLETTDDPVHAHYVQMDNPEHARYSCEYAAMAMLYTPLHNIRPFELAHSRISISYGEAFPEDWQVQYPIAILAAKHHHCQRIYRATCREDEYNRTYERKTVYTLANQVLGDKHKKRAANYQFMVQGMTTDELIPFLPTYANSKAWHMKNLDELAQLTWSCRLPVDGKPCGQCHSCIERTAAVAGTSVVPDIATYIKENEQ